MASAFLRTISNSSWQNGLDASVLENKDFTADSSGGCNTWCFLVLLSWFSRLACGVEEFEDFLAWFHVAEGLAWPVVEFLGDRWHLTDEQRQTYENTLDITGTGSMGYVTIPRIKVKLPVYHGTSEGVLQIAAGHLAGTSLPVGGETTHAVISGHTGLPSAKLLTGLDELQKGDTFAFHVLDETYTYQVDQISVVLPSDISKLNIESGKDYATLITCTPYGVNSHRLLVRGHRIPNPKVPDATTYDEPGYMTAVAALVIGLLVSIIGFACVWLARLWRRGRIVKADRVAAGRHSSGRRA